MGTKLYNKLTNKVKKLEKLQKFKRKLKYLYCNTSFTLWMNICLIECFLSLAHYYAYLLFRSTVREDIIFEIMKAYCNVGCTFSVMYNL